MQVAPSFDSSRNFRYKFDKRSRMKHSSQTIKPSAFTVPWYLRSWRSTVLHIRPFLKIVSSLCNLWKSKKKNSNNGNVSRKRKWRTKYGFCCMSLHALVYGQRNLLIILVKQEKQQKTHTWPLRNAKYAINQWDAKHATGAKHGITCNLPHAQENMTPAPSAGKHDTGATRGKTWQRRQAREIMTRVPSAGRYDNGAKRAKIWHRGTKRGKT